MLAGWQSGHGCVWMPWRSRRPVERCPGSAEAQDRKLGHRGGRRQVRVVAPIPPATITLHGLAVVHPAGSSPARSPVKELGSLIPAERRACASIIEIRPEGTFLTYGGSGRIPQPVPQAMGNLRPIAGWVDETQAAASGKAPHQST
jgi:hypothetical protein